MTRRWLYADERGSVIAIADASGISMATNSYSVYGIPSATNEGRFGWFDTFAVHTHSGATGLIRSDIANTPSGFAIIVIGSDLTLRCYRGK